MNKSIIPPSLINTPMHRLNRRVPAPIFSASLPARRSWRSISARILRTAIIARPNGKIAEKIAKRLGLLGSTSRKKATGMYKVTPTALTLRELIWAAHEDIRAGNYDAAEHKMAIVERELDAGGDMGTVVMV